MTNDLTKPNENEIDDNWISLRAAKNPPLDGLEYRPVYSKKGWNIIHFKDHNGDYGMRIFFEELEFNKLQEKKFPDWNEIKIKRELEAGYFQWVTMSLPASISVQSGCNTPRYPSLKGIMGAKKKEIKAYQVSSFGQQQSIQKIYTPKSSKETVMIEGSTDEIVAKLIDVFKNEIKIN